MLYINLLFLFDKIGTRGGIRTHMEIPPSDFKSDAYSVPPLEHFLVEIIIFELTTFCVQNRCSPKLSYTPIKWCWWGILKYRLLVPKTSTLPLSYTHICFIA